MLVKYVGENCTLVKNRYDGEEICMLVKKFHTELKNFSARSARRWIGVLQFVPPWHKSDCDNHSVILARYSKPMPRDL